MFHAYTYGRGSRQFLILTPKQADAINAFTDLFFEAQKDFFEKNGRHWTPSEPIAFNVNPSSSKKLDHYNSLVKYLNLQHKIRNFFFSLLRIDVSNEDWEDHLVKRV